MEGYKWIMNSRATKHMTLHEAAFNTYEVIFPRNMHVGDDSMAEAIGMGSIVVGIEKKRKKNCNLH
jgi:hypothetical protein